MKIPKTTSSMKKMERRTWRVVADEGGALEAMVPPLFLIIFLYTKIKLY